MGLKIRFFRARMSFGGTTKEKHNTITGIGFKQTSESLPVYKPILTELSSPQIFNPERYGRFQKSKSTKREINAEIALKVRSMLSRSLSNVHTSQENNLRSHKSTDNLPKTYNPIEDNTKYDNQRYDTEIEYEKRKAELLSNCSDSEEEIIIKETPKTTTKSILKKTTVDVTNSNQIDDNEITKNDYHEPKNNYYELVKTNLLDIQDITTSNTNLSNHSSEISEPPPINYSTLPKRNRESITKDWDRLISTDDEDYDTNQEDKAYVIEILEGNGDSIEMKNDKKKKTISFEDQVMENEDSEEIENGRENDQRKFSESSSVHSDDYEENNNSYGNDYTNTKRTSYFHAGDTTFSSQAASIFVGNNKPVNERRPTAFVRARESINSESST